MATKQRTCECGKVCGNGGALASHKRGKTCPLNIPVPAPSNAQKTTEVDEITRMQIHNIELEHKMKMSELTENAKKASELRILETKKASEDAKKAAELRVLETTTIAQAMEIAKAVGNEKIMRIRRTGDVYVEHVTKMTQLAVEDSHQQRLLTQCAHLLTSDEMRVYGTPFLPCFDKLDVDRFIDTRLTIEGPEVDDVKAIMAKMALRQDGVQIGDSTVQRMNLIPLRSLSNLAEMAEAEEDDEEEEDEAEAEETCEKEADMEGCRLVMSFQQKAELKRSIQQFFNREEVDVPTVNKFFCVLAASASKALTSVVRNRVHVPSVLQDMINEQCDLKARKSAWNKFELWSKKTGDAREFPCETCKCTLTRDSFEMGHRVAKSRCGTFNLNNMMVQCGKCNNEQGILHPDLYKECKA